MAVTCPRAAQAAEGRENDMLAAHEEERQQMQIKYQRLSNEWCAPSARMGGGGGSELLQPGCEATGSACPPARLPGEDAPPVVAVTVCHMLQFSVV